MSHGTTTKNSTRSNIVALICRDRLAKCPSIHQACSARGIWAAIALNSPESLASLPVWNEYQKSDKAIGAVSGTAAVQRTVLQEVPKRVPWAMAALLTPTASLRYQMASPCAIRLSARSPHTEVRRRCACHSLGPRIPILRHADGDQASYP